VTAATARGEGIGLGNAGGGALKPSPRSQVNGRLPPETIQKIVRANYAGMKRCYEAGLVTDPKLNGKITTRFIIERDGTVSTAADAHDAPPVIVNLPPGVQIEDPASAPRFPDPNVTACVVARFKELKFPPPEGGIVTVAYPIIFSPGE
jgi:hypothetical protein